MAASAFVYPTGRAFAQRVLAHADELALTVGVGADIPLYREVVEHPQAGRRRRGQSASRLGYLLLNRYPQDRVPDEARLLLAIATEELPRHWHTLLLRAYVLAYDDDAPGSLRAVKHCCDRP